MDIKEKLLKTTLFLDNQYLNKYCELIELNYRTKRQKFKTQKHHILPVIAFRLYNLDEENTSDNLVNLLYRDHILAHYYLALCSKDTEFKYKMIAAINFILGKAKQMKLDANELKDFTLTLDYYQRLYEEAKKHFANKLRGTTHETSLETRQKISIKNRGKVYVNKEGIVRSIYPEDLELFIKNGWIRGNPNVLNRNLHKGDIIIHKDTIEKYIKKEELEMYLNNGWSRGRSKLHIENTRSGITTYYNTLTKDERKKHGHPCTYKGLKRPDGERIGKIVGSKLQGRKQSEKQKLQNSINKKGTIHMTNGEKDIMIKKEREQEFLEKGFYRGRSKNRKERK